MRIHILGLNIFGINAFKLSKKKNFVTTISDIKKKNEFSNLKNFYNKNKKDIFFENHPKKIIKKANLIVINSFGLLQKIIFVILLHLKIQWHDFLEIFYMMVKLICRMCLWLNYKLC